MHYSLNITLHIICSYGVVHLRAKQQMTNGRREFYSLSYYYDLITSLTDPACFRGTQQDRDEEDLSSRNLPRRHFS